MEVTYLPDEETPDRRMANVVRELERWQKAKTKLSIEDRAFVFRIKRMTHPQRRA